MEQSGEIPCCSSVGPERKVVKQLRSSYYIVAQSAPPKELQILAVLS